jgi:adenylate kinase
MPRNSRALLAGALLLVGTIAAQTSGNRFVIVLVGPAGSGKTTQSEFIRHEFGIPTVSVEDLIKQNLAALEKYRTPGIDPGTPRASPAMNALVRARLSKMDLKKGVVLDGYPATKDQADHLAALVKEMGLLPPVVIQIDVPDDVVRARLEKRKAPEDTPEQIERRLKDYHRELDMIRDYYPQANIWTIDGTRPIVDVWRTIQVILRDELPRKR